MFRSVVTFIPSFMKTWNSFITTFLGDTPVDGCNGTTMLLLFLAEQRKQAN
jgi:hypothetical protein